MNLSAQNRIYQQKVTIDSNLVKDFYDKRAAIAEDSSVLLGNSAAIEEKDAFEREIIFNKLNISPQTRIADIGCGIGRLLKYSSLCAAFIAVLIFRRK